MTSSAATLRVAGSGSPLAADLLQALDEALVVASWTTIVSAGDLDGAPRRNLRTFLTRPLLRFVCDMVLKSISCKVSPMHTFSLLPPFFCGFAVDVHSAHAASARAAWRQNISGTAAPARQREATPPMQTSATGQALAAVRASMLRPFGHCRHWPHPLR